METRALEQMTDAEIAEVIKTGQAILKRRDEERKTNALERAIKEITDAGMSADDLIKRLKVRKKPTKPTGVMTVYKSGHLYQHPEHTAQTWNGHGKKPDWAKEVEARGGKLVDLGPQKELVKKAS